MADAIGSVIGGLFGSKSSSDAADASRKGQQEALAAFERGVTQARGDILPLFEGAAQSRQQGFGNALEFLSTAPGMQIAPFQQGNIAAQNQLAGGLPQIQNALLGLPVDFSGFQAQQIGQPNAFNFDLSRFAPPQPDPAAAGPATGPTAGAFGNRPRINSSGAFTGGNRSVLGPRVRGIMDSR